MEEDNYYMRDLEADYRRDLMIMYFRTYWKQILVILIALVMALVYGLSSRAQSIRKRSKVSADILHTYLFDPTYAHIEDMALYMDELSPNMRRLLEINIACSRAEATSGDKANEKALAIKALQDFIATEKDIFWRDLATLIYVDIADVDNKMAELDSLSAHDRPLRLLALEKKIMWYMQHKDYEKAKDLIQHIRTKEHQLPGQPMRLDMLMREIEHVEAGA